MSDEKQIEINKRNYRKHKGKAYIRKVYNDLKKNNFIQKNGRLGQEGDKIRAEHSKVVFSKFLGLNIKETKPLYLKLIKILNGEESLSSLKKSHKKSKKKKKSKRRKR